MSQAYEILSDPEKRKTYDQYGLEFILRGGQPMPDPGDGGAGGPGGMPNFGGGGFGFPPGGMPSGGGTRSFHFSTGGGGANGFNFSDPESIFAEFLRTGSMGGGMGGEDDDMGGIPGLGGFKMGGGMPRRGSGVRTASGRFAGMNGAGPRAPTPEITTIERPLAVTLEELFKGVTKKMKIQRKKYDQNTGKQLREDRILEVPIKPGLKAGSKIKFKDVGDQVEGGTQDLHFVVEEVCLLS